MEKSKKLHLRWWQITLIAVFSFLLIIIVAMLIYFGIYYHAEDVSSYLVSNDKVTYKDDDGYYSFSPKEETDTGIILYPGAKVEAKAYSPLCMELAENGYYVALVRMPFNFALFNSSACRKVKDSHPEIKDFYVAGHSLGGVAASSYVSSHAEEYKGLIFLASFTTSDISQTDLDVLSIYGELDGVLNRDSYEKDKVNLPSDFEEHVIKGGNHAGFASYGKQKGDNERTITGEEQVKETVTAIDSFIIKNR